MRIIFQIIGIVAAAMGLLWILQGLGIVRWPASSFMIDVRSWSWRGLALFAAGVALFWTSRRKRI